jgi:hypothetical protein
VQMSDSDAACRGLAGPVTGGCWQGQLHDDFWKTLGYGAPNGRRCTAAAPDRAWRVPWASSLVCRLHEGDGSGRRGVLHALARARPDRPPGAPTRNYVVAQRSPCFPLFHSPKLERQPQPRPIAPDLASAACCCRRILLPAPAPPRPHTVDRLVYHAACSCRTAPGAGLAPPQQCRWPSPANYALHRRG